VPKFNVRIEQTVIEAIIVEIEAENSQAAIDAVNADADAYADDFEAAKDFVEVSDRSAVDADEIQAGGAH